jgi:transcriptional regulator with XRE-family HTH domain
VKITHVDKFELGSRLAQAREDAGMTQEGLAQAVGLDRTAITRLEKGQRKLSAPELVAIAKTVGRPLAFFVNPPVPSIVSRRRDTIHAHETTRALDTELDLFASDLRTLLEMGLLTPVERTHGSGAPRDHLAAEAMAQDIRRKLSLGNEPIQDLSEACQRLGLYAFSAPLGAGGPDGGCVEISDATATLGATVINGEAPAGRRRMTLTHELGHWLCGDAYDSQASMDSEKMINSFAVHFLASRTGVYAVWRRHTDWPTRDRALAVGASFRLSWSATISQLRNIELISQDEHRTLGENEPRAGDYARLTLSWTDELASSHLSPGFTAACLDGYVSRRLTADRTIELLRGTLTEADLPHRNTQSLDDFRRSFAEHGDARAT